MASVRKAQERKLDVAEMKMLGGVWSNQNGSGTTKKLQERRLQWNGHVTRSEKSNVGKSVLEMKIQNERKRGLNGSGWIA